MTKRKILKSIEAAEFFTSPDYGGWVGYPDMAEILGYDSTNPSQMQSVRHIVRHSPLFQTEYARVDVKIGSYYQTFLNPITIHRYKEQAAAEKSQRYIIRLTPTQFKEWHKGSIETQDIPIKPMKKPSA